MPYDAVMALEKTYTISGGNYTPSTEEYLYLHRDYQEGGALRKHPVAFFSERTSRSGVMAISGNGDAVNERRQCEKKYYKRNIETPLRGLGGLILSS